MKPGGGTRRESSGPGLRAWTPRQYLEIERAAEFKSEYYDGEMYAVAGARESHNLIVTNSVFQLVQQLRARPCRTYPCDMRVQVAASRRYSYPDVIVVCGEPQFLDRRRDTLLNPTLIVEVLSPSTDRGTLHAPNGWPMDPDRRRTAAGHTRPPLRRLPPDTRRPL